MNNQATCVPRKHYILNINLSFQDTHDTDIIDDMRQNKEGFT